MAPDKLARVYSFDMIGSFIARPVGLALTGPVAELVGFRTWLLVVGAVIVTSLPLLPSSRRHGGRQILLSTVLGMGRNV